MTQYREVSGNYRVQQNDTLWSVASKLRPDRSISVEQMMLALVRENPEAAMPLPQWIDRLHWPRCVNIPRCGENIVRR